MWREKTDAEKRAWKRIRRRRKILAAVLVWAVLLHVVATSPAWNGRKLWGLVLPIPRLVPDAPALPRCSLCDKPVPLETSKTDEYGKAVHDECYALKMRLKQDTSPSRQGRR